MVPFREAPAFEDNDTRFTGITTVAQLLAMPGWIPATVAGAPLANTIVTGFRQEGANNYVMFTQFPFTALPPSEVKAVAFLTNDNEVIFVTDTPFGGEKMVIEDGDGVTASPDSTLSGSNRWLFGFADAPAGGGGTSCLSLRGLCSSLSAPRTSNRRMPSMCGCTHSAPT